MTHIPWPSIVTIAMLAALGGRAGAGPFVVGDVPAAFAVSERQHDLFGAGLMPSIGAYLPAGDVVSFGVRLRAGALADGAAMAGPGVSDPDRAGLVALGIGVRFARSGGWLEVVGGGGLTGGDAVRTAELGVGWTFTIGALGIGPSLRYLDVGARDRPISWGAAHVVLAGIELQLGGSRRPSRRRAVAVAPGSVIADDERALVDVDQGCTAADPTCTGRDRDGDQIVDGDDRCPDVAETVNGVEDRDGCPDHGEFVVVSDRIVLDEHILFDVNRARIKRSGRPVIAAIAHAIEVHPEWTHVAIEGHADIRGTGEFNAWLSGVRAARVRAALIAEGVPAETVSATGYGASRPIAPGRDERAHQRNRRVEFAITLERIATVAP